MRFPDTPFMKRVFDLIRNRNLSVTLIPFIMEMVEPSPNTFLFYNNARVNNQDHSIVGDPFDVLSYVGEPDLTTPQGVSQKVAEVLQRFRDRFRTRFGDRPPDIAAAIGWLYEQAGGLSMRAYMSQVVGMDDKQISWCETLDKSTGWYDRALAESAQFYTFHGFLVVTWDYHSRHRELGPRLAHCATSRPRATQSWSRFTLALHRVRVGCLRAAQALL